MPSQGFGAALWLVGAVLLPSMVSASSGVPAVERLQSCEPTIAVPAAREIVSRSESLKEPLEMFAAAGALFRHGQKDEAVFWFYAAQLRARYQLVFEQGDRAQILTIMLMTIGPPINNYAFQDISNLERILDRVLAWDAKTPNPFRDGKRTPDHDRKIEQIYTGLRDMRVKMAAEKDDLEDQARLFEPEIAQMYAERARAQCGQNQHSVMPVEPTRVR